MLDKPAQNQNVPESQHVSMVGPSHDANTSHDTSFARSIWNLYLVKVQVQAVPSTEEHHK